MIGSWKVKVGVEVSFGGRARGDWGYPGDVATHVAKNWNELIDRLFADSWQAPLARFRSKLAFRGMQDVRSDLSTSLARLGGRFERQEGHLLRNFRKFAHREAPAAGAASPGSPVPADSNASRHACSSRSTATSWIRWIISHTARS